jgi:hypothetical protein
MTSLENPVLTDTTLPAPSRQVWHAPEVRSHSLVVLTPTRLYLTPPGMNAEPGDVLGLPATAIELATVRRVVHDLAADTLRVEHAAAGRSAEATIAFATAEAADDGFAGLMRRLGPAFELAPPRPAGWAEARGPVAAMLGILAATLALALAASAADDFPAVTAAGKLLQAMDWRVVCGLGGAALAVVQARLYRRLTQPPARLELVRR